MRTLPLISTLAIVQFANGLEQRNSREAKDNLKMPQNFYASHNPQGDDTACLSFTNNGLYDLYVQLVATQKFADATIQLGLQNGIFTPAEQLNDFSPANTACFMKHERNSNSTKDSFAYFDVALAVNPSPGRALFKVFNRVKEGAYCVCPDEPNASFSCKGLPTFFDQNDLLTNPFCGRNNDSNPQHLRMKQP